MRGACCRALLAPLYVVYMILGILAAGGWACVSWALTGDRPGKGLVELVDTVMEPADRLMRKAGSW